MLYIVEEKFTGKKIAVEDTSAQRAKERAIKHWRPLVKYVWIETSAQFRVRDAKSI